MPARTRSQRLRNRGRTGVVISPPTGPQQRKDVTSSPTSRINMQPKTKAAEPDYSYVFRDLKHTAIIVGGILAIFFILRFTLLT